MNYNQESKYFVNDKKQIANRHTGTPIPDDEPIMIFRARDKNAVLMIAYYKKLCRKQSHIEAVNTRLHQFRDFAHANPERMKEPDTSETPDKD